MRGNTLARAATRVSSGIAVGIVVVLALGGCGSSSTSSSAAATSSSSTSAPASSSTSTTSAASAPAPAAIAALTPSASLQSQAKAAGMKDAAAAGAPTKLPAGKKIGVIELSGQSATSQRIVAAVKQIAGLLHYTVTTCDPNFDETKIPECATSILAQSPDVIISVSQNPGPMGSAVQQAGQRHIPWFDVASGVTPSRYIFNYGENGTTLVKTLDAWLFPAMGQHKSGSTLQLAALSAPTVGLGALTNAQLMADVKADPKVDLVVNHDLDLANIVPDTLSTTKNVIQRYPNLAGMETVCDLCVPLMAQALTSAGAKGSNRPLVTGEYSTPQTVADIRSGTADAVADYPWETAVWVAMDQALEHWARGKTIAPALAPAAGSSSGIFSTGYSLKFMQPYVLTKSNVGASGPIPILGPDFVTYFETKWNKEFGVGG